MFFLSVPALAQNLSPVWFDSVFNQKSPGGQEALRQLEANHLVAVENHNTSEQVQALIHLTAFHVTQSKDYGKAMDWMLRCMEEANASQGKAERVFSLVALARVFNGVEELSEALKYLDQAHALVTEKEFVLLNFILNERGRVLMQANELSDALADYELLLKHAKASELPDHEADALYNLGVVRTKRKEFDVALKTHREALALRRKLKNRAKEAESLNSVGELYLAQKNFERAKANFTLAINIRKKLKDEGALAESYFNLGSMYGAEKDIKQAIKTYEQGLAHAFAFPETAIKIHEVLSRSYKADGNFKKALEHQELYTELLFLITSERDTDAIHDAQNRFTIQEKEEKIDKLATDMKAKELTIATQNRERNFLIAFLGLGLVIGGLIVWLYMQKQRSNKVLKELNATKDKLFSIIGHDLRGPLNSLTAFFSLLVHGDGLTREEIKMLSADVDKSLKNLYGLLENLLEWARSQTGSMDFTPAQFDVGQMVSENIELLKPIAERKQIAIEYLPTQAQVKAHKHSINTVVRNLISNAIKFTREGGKVMVKIEPHQHQVQISITDNGVGMKKELLKRLFKVGEKVTTLGTAKEKGTGLGLVLCKEFVEKNGGSIQVESEEGKGSRFWFTVNSGS